MDFDTVTTREVSAMNPVEGDLLLDEVGDVVVARGRRAVVTHVRVRLRFLQGECVFDQRLGFPYRTIVFRKNPNLDLIRSLIRSTIEGTPGVETVTELRMSFSRAERRLSIRFRATTTTYGVIDSDEYAPFILEL